MELFTIGKDLVFDDEASVLPFLDAIDVQHVKTLRAGGNSFGGNAAIALARALSRCQQLETVDLSNIFANRETSEIRTALAALCDSLLSLPSLIDIDLSDNALELRSCVALVPFLTQHRTLRTLRLNNNGLGPEGGSIIAQALITAVDLCRIKGEPFSLRTLHCGQNQLGDDGSAVFAETLKAHASLIELRLPHNEIHEAGMRTLAEALASCTSLQVLDLQDNISSDGGGSSSAWNALGHAVRYWPSLRILDLSDCGLTTRGARLLLDALDRSAQECSLELLRLENNELDEDVSRMLYKAAKHIPSLFRIEIQWNELDPDNSKLVALSNMLRDRGGALLIDEDEEDEEVIQDEAVDAELAKTLETFGFTVQES